MHYNNHLNIRAYWIMNSKNNNWHLMKVTYVWYKQCFKLYSTLKKCDGNHCTNIIKNVK